MIPALVFEAVTRCFARTVALDGLSLTVGPGQIVGLVGRNGAGKTTALRLALGDLYPDRGSIRVLGLDPIRDGLAVREQVSLLAEENALYPWMKVGEILRLAGALHPRWDAQVADTLARKLDLEPGKKVAALSRGGRAKVALVLAVACRPRLLLLDDPTAGLDPLVRREVLEGILETIHAEGGTVIYASHLVEDIERIADRVVVLDEGRITLDGAVDDLKQRIRRATAVFDGRVPSLEGLPGKIRSVVEGRVLHLVVDAQRPELLGVLEQAGARTVEFESLSLEEILVARLGEDAVGESAGGAG